jgi:uncharacterized membrane protein YqiK
MTSLLVTLAIVVVATLIGTGAVLFMYLVTSRSGADEGEIKLGNYVGSVELKWKRHSSDQRQQETKELPSS